MNRPKIMGIGELVWDLLPDGRQLGGAPVNFAYWCNRLGAEGYPVSAVGSDDLGREAFDRLAATGLDLGYVQHNALPTGRVNVTLSGNGIPEYDIVEGVAWDALEADAGTLELAARPTPSAGVRLPSGRKRRAGRSPQYSKPPVRSA